MSRDRSSIPAAWAVYRDTARRRRKEEREAEQQRCQQARQIAEEAAALLRREFGATQVLLFGSLAHGLWFTKTSDLDLAAAGISTKEFFTAVARLQDLSPHFQIDLVDLDHCPPHLREAIHAEGQPL